MRNRYVMKIVMLFWLSIFSSAIMAAEEVNVSVDRSWGILLGDEVNVTVDIRSLSDSVVESSLPELNKRYGTWLYLKEITSTAEQLVLHYQVVNVPNKNVEIKTPPFDVKLNNEQWFLIPSISLTIGPSLAVGEAGAGDVNIKPDSKPTLVSTAEMTKQLKLFGTAAVLSIIILVLWHFGWKTKNRQPFAQAVHDLSRFNWGKSLTSDQASRILHNAFNHTSNTVVVYGELANLFDNYEWLLPLKEDIEAFYQQSEQRFFARQTGQELDIDMMRKLAKACRSKEMLA